MREVYKLMQILQHRKQNFEASFLVIFEVIFHVSSMFVKKRGLNS